jgi:hypothetical protein
LAEETSPGGVPADAVVEVAATFGPGIADR